MKVGWRNRTSGEKKVSQLNLKSKAIPRPCSSFLYHSTNIITAVPNAQLQATFRSKINVNEKDKGMF